MIGVVLFFEIQVMTLCLLVLAIEPAKKLWREWQNRKEREVLHKMHLKSLEEEHG